MHGLATLEINHAVTTLMTATFLPGCNMTRIITAACLGQTLGQFLDRLTFIKVTLTVNK